MKPTARVLLTQADHAIALSVRHWSEADRLSQESLSLKDRARTEVATAREFEAAAELLSPGCLEELRKETFERQLHQGLTSGIISALDVMVHN